MRRWELPDRCNSQVPSVTTRKRIVRHCSVAPALILTVCVAERYLTLCIVSTGEYTVPPAVEKNPLPFLFSERSPPLISPDYEIKETGVPRG